VSKINMKNSGSNDANILRMPEDIFPKNLSVSKSKTVVMPDLKDFAALKKAYKKSWGIDLKLTGPDGKGHNDNNICLDYGLPECLEIRRLVITEALRWGEPVIKLCSRKRFLWGLPLMANRLVTGGVIAEISEDMVFPDDSGKPGLDIVKAAVDLLRLAGLYNLTNIDLLENKQAYYKKEELRAHSIQYFKTLGISEIRDMYSRIEPDLLLAIRQGNKKEARGHINTLLTAILHQAQGKFELIKGQFMELVTTMYRTAIELGGTADTLLGKNYASLVEFSKITCEEDLSFWLSNTLDTIMDSIHRHSLDSKPFQIQTAINYMKERLAEDITREDAARAACMSISHFSRQFKRHYGCCFSELLNRLRVDKARELLADSTQTIAEVAQGAGFNDQSYFNKVFRRYVSASPQQYRNFNR
jgi:AraC-like DNA-binding protein